MPKIYMLGKLGIFTDLIYSYTQWLGHPNLNQQVGHVRIKKCDDFMMMNYPKDQNPYISRTIINNCKYIPEAI